MDIYNKYLKYKKKYLELKGSCICHNIALHQHSGECWNVKSFYIKYLNLTILEILITNN